MKNIFRPNLSRAGRIVRAVLAVALLIGAIVAVRQIVWLGVGLFISAIFVFFEAARGWCVVRACGIRTKI